MCPSSFLKSKGEMSEGRVIDKWNRASIDLGLYLLAFKLRIVTIFLKRLRVAQTDRGNPILGWKGDWNAKQTEF